ncbi:TfpX/TfpZ family type IV pilin accessory protein [Acinetobacter soli]|uniref:TfpX/TfpZ family type IV pilin accessory protein n=1 Tax=Acinetobacter soli TaxID=487316 RepID=UPI00258D4A6F|nr:TfpX/TfpZ family type IV pilin accessory protein [Acinetobacter soli]MDQ8995861.1 TfpX/TfpZ family type IV pilin accessory protein [Acinetobacter soli]
MSKRINFFLSHFILSFFIGLVIVLLVFFVWYPYPLEKATGVTHLTLILFITNIIVGPFLGFIIYKNGKKTLKFDLTVIVLIQLSALFYGFYHIAEGRPVWIVYNVDRFELIRKNDIVENNIKNALPIYRETSLLKPAFVAAEFSKNTTERNQNMFDEVLGGISIAQRPERYISLEKVKSKIVQRSQGLASLNQFNSTNKIESILKKYPEADGWLPLTASVKDMVVLVNKKQERVISIVDLRPWK